MTLPLSKFMCFAHSYNSSFLVTVIVSLSWSTYWKQSPSKFERPKRLQEAAERAFKVQLQGKRRISPSQLILNFTEGICTENCQYTTPASVWPRLCSRHHTKHPIPFAMAAANHRRSRSRQCGNNERTS
jgi:hypothetical protein